MIQLPRRRREDSNLLSPPTTSAMKVSNIALLVTVVLTFTTSDRVRAVGESPDDGRTATDTCETASDEGVPSSSSSSGSVASHVVGEEPFGSTILVWDDFLDPVFLQSLYETYLGNSTTEWRPVIPHHRQAYQAAVATTALGTDENPLFRAPLQGRGNGGFPGLRANLTRAYHEALHQKILREWPAETIQNVTGSPIANQDVRWSSIDSFFGNLCYHPNSLNLDQRLPHMDQGHVEQRRPVKMALVHYLSPRFAGRGGTAFYAETASGGNRFRYRDCQTLKERARQMGLKSGTTAFIKAASCHCKPMNLACTQYQWYVDQVTASTISTSGGGGGDDDDDDGSTSSSYASGTTEWYTLLHHVPYRYNRAVLYDARQLHSAFVDEEDTLGHLTCDPTRGRLTANVFFG